MKTVKYFEDFDLLIKCVTQTIENETKEQRSGFLSKWLGRLGASLLGNILASRRVIQTDNIVTRAGQDF